MTNNLISKSSNLLVKVIGVFLLVFSIMAIIQGVYGLRVGVNRGRFGIEYDIGKDNKSLVITRIVKGYPADLAGLKEGDLITLFQGQTLDEILELKGKRPTTRDTGKIWADAVAGSQMNLTIDREGKKLVLTMTRMLMPVVERLLEVLTLIVFPAIMLAYILVGIWGVFKKPSFITNLIALVCFAFGAMLCTIGLGAEVTSPLSKYLYFSEIRGVLAALGLQMTPALWLFLFVNFPKKTIFYLKHKYLTLSLIFFFPLLSLATNFLFPDFARKLQSIKWLGFIYPVYFGLFIFYGIYILSRGARKEENILKKRQYQLMRFGVRYGAVSMSTGIAGIILYESLLKDIADFIGWLVFFLFLVTQVIALIIPFTFLNSFFQDRILETESALRRKLRHIGSTSLLFLTYLLVTFFLGKYLIEALKLTETSFIILIILLLSLTFAPLNSWVLRRLEQKLYPEKTMYKVALRKMIRNMPSFIEESQILENLSRWISETMGIRTIYAASIDMVGIQGIPLKRNSEKSVLAKVKDGSSFFWDEIIAQPGETIDIEEEEKLWAEQKGISITVPMISRGEQIGLLSIGKKQNNDDFTGDDLEIFQEAAFHTALALQNVKLQLEHLEKKRIDKELEVARNIQVHLMPGTIPEVEGLQLHGEYRPCFEVGGDYFDIIPVDKSKTALVIADVSGKGAGAAILMSNLQASLRMAISFSIPPTDIAYKINNMIMENSLNNQFITFFIAIWDNETKTLQYINAGHNPPVIITSDNKMKQLNPTGIGLGIKGNREYKSKTIQLEVGDVITIFTDGIEEYFNFEGEPFGTGRMFESFHASRELHPRDVIAKLFKNLSDFSGGKKAAYSDDIAIITAKRVE
ncbi:MAG: SpoIIE family protein phosphatase [bacterium]|nr:SpoIIE family protein phosphatase [bacterium]